VLQPATKAQIKKSDAQAPVHLTFGGEFGSGKRHAEKSVAKTQEDENRIINVILKAVIDIMSEVGLIKKMVRPPPDVLRHVNVLILKKGWRAS
jgi:hypothetical protein